MKQLLTLVLTLLLLVGCNPSKFSYTVNPPDTDKMHMVTPVYIDKKFPFDQKVEIIDALLEWNYALNGYNTFEVVSDQFDMEQDVLRRIMHTNQGLLILDRSVEDPAYSDLQTGVLAWVEGDEPIVNVFGDVVGNRNLKAITMHEIGHYLGIHGHVMIKGSLMFPSYTYMSPCIDKATVQALSGYVSYYDWRHMAYCERP